MSEERRNEDRRKRWSSVLPQMTPLLNLGHESQGKKRERRREGGHINSDN